MENIIKFTSIDYLSEKILEPPTPAINFMPIWYKKSKPVMDGYSSPGLYGGGKESAVNTTYKSCSPFMDSFATGYMWSAPVDMEVLKISENGSVGYSIRWRTEGDFVSSHSEEQHPNLPKQKGGLGSVLKWEFPFSIETPTGYSVLFTHPLNRFDLPFRTLSGVVDTDDYKYPVKFPFQLMDMDSDSLIIEKGTPLCQIIPIKRDSWTRRTEVCTDEELRKNNFDYFSKIVKSYKGRYWHRKEYK